MTLPEEHPFRGEEHPDGVRDGIAAYLPNQLDEHQRFTPPSQELFVLLEVGNSTINITRDQLEKIVPSDQPGWYEVHFKGDISKKQKIAGAVSVLVLGAALLAGVKGIRRRSKS